MKLEEIATPNVNVKVVGKYTKDGKKYSLWDKTVGWHELTCLEDGKFKSVDEWHNKSLEEIDADLAASGYSKVDA